MFEKLRRISPEKHDESEQTLNMSTDGSPREPRLARTLPDEGSQRIADDYAKYPGQYTVIESPFVSRVVFRTILEDLDPELLAKVKQLVKP